MKSGGYNIDRKICSEISQLLKGEAVEEETEFVNNLIECTSFGISFHHAGLQLFQRELIENAFIDKKIKVIVSTPTLEQGVNLPSNVVIVSDVVRWNSNDRCYDPLPVNSVINMMGRAGRPEYQRLRRSSPNRGSINRQ